MPNDLPPEIEVVTTPRGERYELPQRHVGCLRVAAGPVIFIALIFSGSSLFMALASSGLIQSLTGGSGSVDILQVFIGAVFFLVSGLIPLAFGCFMYGGRNTIELRDDWLIATHHGGPLRWRRKMPVKDVLKLEIKTGNPESSSVGTHPMIGALNAELVGGGRRNLAWGYHKDTLGAMAKLLTERCRVRDGATLVDDNQITIVVEERTLGQWSQFEAYRRAHNKNVSDLPPETNEITPQPTDSTVILEPNDVGLTITVPPVGIRKGGKGGLGFSIMWNGFMAVFTFFWFYSGSRFSGWELLLICGFLSLFWAVGIGVGVAAINAGRRRAILDVVGDTLLITRQNIFKTRQQEVHRDNIQSIRRDKSGTEINDVPVLNLQVRLYEGKKVSMFSQLSNDEIGWVAAVLREALDVPSR
jgi:hypothetical protein